MSFFAGDLDGKNAHDDLAKKIADNGKDYATRFWRYADMEACASQFLSLFPLLRETDASSTSNRLLSPRSRMGSSRLFVLLSSSLTSLPLADASFTQRTIERRWTTTARNRYGSIWKSGTGTGFFFIASFLFAFVCPAALPRGSMLIYCTTYRERGGERKYSVLKRRNGYERSAPVLRGFEKNRQQLFKGEEIEERGRTAAARGTPGRRERLAQKGLLALSRRRGRS